MHSQMVQLMISYVVFINILYRDKTLVFGVIWILFTGLI